MRTTNDMPENDALAETKSCFDAFKKAIDDLERVERQADELLAKLLHREFATAMRPVADLSSSS